LTLNSKSKLQDISRCQNPWDKTKHIAAKEKIKSLTKAEWKNKRYQNLKNFSRLSRYSLAHQKIAKKLIAKKYFLLSP
jgi:hypothetical protein